MASDSFCLEKNPNFLPSPMCPASPCHAFWTHECSSKIPVARLSQLLSMLFLPSRMLLPFSSQGQLLSMCRSWPPERFSLFTFSSPILKMGNSSPAVSMVTCLVVSCALPNSQPVDADSGHTADLTAGCYLIVSLYIFLLTHFAF